MEQKRIHRIIETIASKKFSGEKELLIEVAKQIVENNQINVTGGRIWKLDIENKGYSLVFQTGNVSKISDDYFLKLADYPIFDKIASDRTILANETDKTLISKGIFKYSASGVGSKVKLNGNQYYQYLIAVNSDDIGDELRYTLNIVATVLTSKIREKRISVTQKNLMEDLDKAKLLQKSLLPEHEYRFHDYDLFGITIPAETLGGDFFDYVRIGDDEERIGIILGDAASKGIVAAAEAMYISGALRMASTFQMKISPMMNRMNQLVNKIFSDDKFVSLFYGELSKDKKGLFLYANAGHNPPIFISRKTGRVSYLAPTGPLLGPAPNMKYETDSINFNDGDVLVIYSDGITEAADPDFNFYEEKRLEDVIRKNMDKSPKEIVYAILDDVIKFSTSKSKYQDDKTIVIIKKKDGK